jgi:argininosuccinate synthase
MSSQKPLQGTDLVDCAKANEAAEVAVAADLCGYGNDIEMFESELKLACTEMGIEIDSFRDLQKLSLKS